MFPFAVLNSLWRTSNLFFIQRIFVRIHDQAFEADSLFEWLPIRCQVADERFIAFQLPAGRRDILPFYQPQPVF